MLLFKGGSRTGTLGALPSLYDCITHIYFNCSQHAMITICILSSTLITKHWVYVKEHLNNSQTQRILPFGRTVEITGSATAVDPWKFSTMFGSFRLFPIFDLVKIQPCKLDICRLVILRNEAIYRYSKACKGMTDWKNNQVVHWLIDWLIGYSLTPYRHYFSHATAVQVAHQLYIIFTSVILKETWFKSTFSSMHAWVVKFTA